MKMPGNVAGLSYSQRSGAPAACDRPGAGRPEGVDMAEGTERRVQMLGGPDDGRVLLTTCLDIETLGVREGDGWRLPREDDTYVTHVYYRVRRTVDGEWVATFEGPRPIENLL